MLAAISLGASELGTGLAMGLAYALLGIGLVLVHRTTRVLHMGYGEVGAFGAVLLGYLVVDRGVSWWVAFPFVVVLGGAISAAWELLVVRRLFDSSRLVLLAATIGVGQVMFAFQVLLPDGHRGAAALYPTPLDYHRQLGSFTLRGDHLLVLGCVPFIVGALAWLMNRTVWGLAIRGGAENADAATLAGIQIRRVSTLVWALAGALSTATFVLVLPIRGVVLGTTTQVLGPGLLLRALAVALIGRLESLPAVVAGGVAVGVAEATLLSNIDSSGTIDLAFFGLVMVLLLVRGGRDGERERSSVSGLARTTDPTVRRLPIRPILTVALAAAVAAPFVLDTPGQQFRLATIVVLALVGVSTTVVTGWAGQISLSQFTFVGIGAVATAGLTARGMGFGWAVLYASIGCGVVATLIGIPALRIRGLFLASATLAFAVGANGGLLDQAVFRDADDRLTVPRASLGPFDLAEQRTYYFTCLAVLVGVGVLVATLRRTGLGRSIIAVRENEPAAASFGIAPAAMKLCAFAMSGAIAGLAGGLYGGLLVNLRPTGFGPDRSFQVLAMAIIGGVTSVGGAVLGAVYVEGVPLLLGDSLAARALTTGVGLIVLLVVVRGGLLDAIRSAFEGLARRYRWDRAIVAEAVPPLRHPVPAGSRGQLPSADEWEAPALTCRGVEVRFGGVLANSGIDLELRRGEVLGLIGTNGAGKSTLMNAIGGFTPTQAGTITAWGKDITDLRAHERSRLGIGRMFQDAALFAELTVEECVLVSLEACSRTEVVPTLLRLPAARRIERGRAELARELIVWNGLEAWAEVPVGRLSTGTRRIVELTCLTASAPRVILLDEPSAGIAQREVEALARRLIAIKDQLGASVILIEHDMPLVMSVCDRIICMSAGRIIAEGTPDEVRNDPEVIAAYLGSDERAIRRSNLAAASR